MIIAGKPQRPASCPKHRPHSIIAVVGGWGKSFLQIVDSDTKMLDLDFYQEIGTKVVVDLAEFCKFALVQIRITSTSHGLTAYPPSQGLQQE